MFYVVLSSEPLMRGKSGFVIVNHSYFFVTLSQELSINIHSNQNPIGDEMKLYHFITFV